MRRNDRTRKVAGRQLWARRAHLPHGDLLSECEVLQRQLPLRANRGPQCPNEDRKPSHHVRSIADQSRQPQDNRAGRVFRKDTRHRAPSYDQPQHRLSENQLPASLRRSGSVRIGGMARGRRPQRKWFRNAARLASLLSMFSRLCRVRCGRGFLNASSRRPGASLPRLAATRLSRPKPVFSARHALTAGTTIDCFLQRPAVT